MKVNELLTEVETVDKKPSAKEVPIDKPGGFNVMVLNNDVTPGQVVVEALMHGIGITAEEAIKRMMKIHKTGWSAVAAYASRDLAETVANKIEKHAAGNTRYDAARQLNGHKGPWPLDTEVMEAGER